jgi:2-oxoglutarate dehydrogenase E2 component (dihydrolipoamide succinyltransferase)
LAEVTLPSLGESVTEGIITQWFKKVGEAVARDESLFEVSTDKVDSEMPSPASGVLVQILAAEGDTVQTGAVVAIIDESATASVASGEAAPVTASAPQSTTPVAAAATHGEAGVLLSPVVRRILADGGVEPSTVVGTGTGGAITRRDAERAVALGPTEEVVHRLSNGQRRMGAHMSVSALSAPHGFVAVEVDASMFDQLELRRGERADVDGLTDEVVIGLAGVRALSDFPFLNAFFIDEQLLLQRTVNVGFTRHVSDDGMLVPVVHAAAGLSLDALASRVSDVDGRLATRQLTADDLMGGTFTIAGATSAHTVWSQPILNHPQVAVLSIGAVRQIPVVVNDGNGPTLSIGRRVVLGLTFDHRVCDASQATAYLERVGEILAELDLSSER